MIQGPAQVDCLRLLVGKFDPNVGQNNPKLGAPGWPPGKYSSPAAPLEAQNSRSDAPPFRIIFKVTPLNSPTTTDATRAVFATEPPKEKTDR